MGFIFGLMVGSALSSASGPPQVQQALSQIPFRCLALVDDEAQYRRCRYPSMRENFYGKAVLGCMDTFNESRCKDNFTDENIKWELTAIKQLADAAAKEKK